MDKGSKVFCNKFFFPNARQCTVLSLLELWTFLLLATHLSSLDMVHIFTTLFAIAAMERLLEGLIIITGSCGTMTKYVNMQRNRDAVTLKYCISIFDKHSRCYSELWQLPYWNPTHQLVVDPLHTLFDCHISTTSWSWLQLMLLLLSVQHLLFLIIVQLPTKIMP